MIFFHKDNRLPIFSLTELIFLNYVVSHNLEIKDSLVRAIGNLYVSSRVYTAAGMFVNCENYKTEAEDREIVLPDCVDGDYLCINNQYDAVVILHTDTKNITALEVVSMQYEFDELVIASYIFRKMYLDWSVNGERKIM